MKSVLFAAKTVCRAIKGDDIFGIDHETRIAHLILLSAQERVRLLSP